MKRREEVQKRIMPTLLWVCVLTACGDATVEDPTVTVDSGSPDAGAVVDAADGAATPDGEEPAPDGTVEVDGSSDAATPDGGVVETCVDNEEFFADAVYGQVLEPRCMACHTSEGLARDSDLVLIGPVQPNYLEANLEVLTQVASLEQSGTSIVLLKPRGELAHGGGAVLSELSPEFEILQEFVARIAEPVVCPDTGVVDDGETGLEVASSLETLRQASLSLAGRLPTARETEDVRFGGEAALEGVIRAMTSEEVFYDRVEQIFNDQLLSERYLDFQSALSLLNDDVYVSRYWYEGMGGDAEGIARSRTNRAMSREPLELISWIVRNDRPFTEILTADYTVVNDYTAFSWGLEDAGVPDLQDPASEVFRQVRIPGWQHAGVLSTPVFVNRFPTTPTNRNRHRARVFFDRFLATDILAFAERPADPTESAYHNATLNDPQCTVCHATMDPVAGLFQNFDVNGHLSAPENGWFPDLAPPGFARESLPMEGRDNPLRWLAEQTVTDARFALAMAHTVYEGFAGSEPLRPVTDRLDVEGREAYNAQRAQFDRIAAQFAADNFDFRTLVTDLFMSDLFRATGPGTASPGLVASAGSAHYLTPEELDLKITAALGIPWRSRWDRRTNLSDTYRLLYGGIDSNGTVVRLRAPNGIMINIADRMATEMACRAVPQDFVVERESRRLFPYVQPTYVPEFDDGLELPEVVALIRQNIQHLHYRLLGEELELDDPEIDATYALFYDLWRDGETGVDNDTVREDLASSCRATNDPFTNAEYPQARRVTNDPEYAIRAWMGVVAYLLTDYRFLSE